MQNKDKTVNEPAQFTRVVNPPKDAIASYKTPQDKMRQDKT
jgi:hypothetical protein